MKRSKSRPPEYSSGPTAERIAKSEGEFAVGDDQQGTKVYTFKDSPLARLYKRLSKADKSEAEQKQLTSEHVALMKYRHHWHCAGLEGYGASVDLNRIFSSDPSNFSGMAKTEAQVSHRQMYRRAAQVIGHEASILLDNFVCYEWDRGIASSMSYHRFRKAIRDAGAKLAVHWNT